MVYSRKANCMFDCALIVSAGARSFNRYIMMLRMLSQRYVFTPSEEIR
jgi:hypothetical protein